MCSIILHQHKTGASAKIKVKMANSNLLTSIFYWVQQHCYQNYCITPHHILITCDNLTKNYGFNFYIIL